MWLLASALLLPVCMPGLALLCLSTVTSTFVAEGLQLMFVNT